MRNELNLTLSKHQELVEKNDAILGQIKLYQSQLKDVQLERNQILEKNRFLILENENLKNAHEATTESLREKEKEVASLTEEIKEIRSDFILLIEESEKSANKALYIESLLKDSNPDLSQSAFSSISLKVNLDILTEKMEKALSENSLLISKLKSTTVMLIQDENKNLEKLLSSEKEKNQEIADLFTSIDYKLLKEKEIIRLKSEINSEIEKCNGFYLEKIKLEEELQKFKNDNSVIQYKQVVNELSTCISELIANPI